MKRVYLLFIVLSLIPFGLLAQLSITIKIYELRNNNGQVHLELSNENEAQISAATKDITGNKTVIVIEGLEPGKYAFKFIHDENNNNKLDTNWLGIPKEGFGFSNNPSMTFGPPSFEKTIFELNESMTIKCKPKYF
ncbi:DUF2141 domain-containing protein [Perlabentimonas gracilis]|jgi:uncharacterized protein (DUF2141 family)|uniref:DUF2141 domain-containing protein n=1 Tax=Perlabentimonas gracilis TaxID=2715279 RepID=UPI0014090264|nr:DUF2141 domain-containing protein [Perlabentimonas gracilis]NHB67762.1 DUF2141 domain-containing protein [Perlabentimonas gracilis]